MYVILHRESRVFEGNCGPTPHLQAARRFPSFGEAARYARALASEAWEQWRLAVLVLGGGATRGNPEATAA